MSDQVLNIDTSLDWEVMWGGLLATTDYPIKTLGDKSDEPAPLRAVEIISYDGDKHCQFRVLSHPGVFYSCKSGYLYKQLDVTGKACFPNELLHRLPDWDHYLVEDVGQVYLSKGLMISLSGQVNDLLAAANKIHREIVLVRARLIDAGEGDWGALNKAVSFSYDVGRACEKLLAEGL